MGIMGLNAFTLSIPCGFPPAFLGTFGLGRNNNYISRCRTHKRIIPIRAMTFGVSTPTHELSGFLVHINGILDFKLTANGPLVFIVHNYGILTSIPPFRGPRVPPITIMASKGFEYMYSQWFIRLCHHKFDILGCQLTTNGSL
ncbi:Hypothetical protein FKW44_022853, partial [Caligus rogercresseyi]